MSTLCDGLDSNISAIVAQWKQLTNRPPWTTLSAADWVDHLPPLLRAMIEGVVCHGGSHEARQRVVEQAILHGAHRRRHGLSLDNILEEQAQLRQATWRFLTEKAESIVNSTIVTEIVRLDGAISVATIASLSGFHQAEIERTREWDEVIARLVENWEQTSLTGEASSA
jgi:hypothetical protein